VGGGVFVGLGDGGGGVGGVGVFFFFWGGGVGGVVGLFFVCLDIFWYFFEADDPPSFPPSTVMTKRFPKLILTIVFPHQEI